LEEISGERKGQIGLGGGQGDGGVKIVEAWRGKKRTRNAEKLIANPRGRGAMGRNKKT